MSISAEFEIIRRLKKLNKKINTILIRLEEMENNMSAELDNLTVEVTEMSTVVDSAVTLIQGLSARLTEIANDPTAITALATELDTKAKQLSDAIVANTPATPKAVVVQRPAPFKDLP